MFMGGGGGLESEQFFYELFTKPAVQRIRTRLEGAPRESLESICQDYTSHPWYKRWDRNLFPYAPRNFENNLEYIFARDLLNGTFSWEAADEEQRRREQEFAQERAKDEERREWLRKGKSVQLFLGSLDEYEKFTGSECEIVDAEFVHLHPYNITDTYLTMGRLSVDALIRYDASHGIGIPVRKKPLRTINS